MGHPPRSKLSVIPNCKFCKGPSGLFKLPDWLWEAAGLTATDGCCIECFGNQLDCTVSISDMEPFPWFKTHPEYERGVIDGLKGAAPVARPEGAETMEHRQYRGGVGFGRRIALQSDQGAIDYFIEHNPRPKPEP